MTLDESVSLRAVVRDPNGAVIRSGLVRWSPAGLVTCNDPRGVLFNASTAGTFAISAYFGDVHSGATIFVLVPLKTVPSAEPTAEIN